MIATFASYLRGLLECPDGIVLHQGSYSEAPIQQLIEYRDREYRLRGQAYLLSAQLGSNGRNAELDRRSHHFWVARNGYIVGAMRATPPPSEFESLAPQGILARHTFPRHLELGRLITNASDGVSALSRKLLAGACLHGVENDYAGVVAMCRPPQRRLFERFGLAALSESFVVTERNDGKYWLMHATWHDIVSALPPEVDLAPS